MHGLPRHEIDDVVDLQFDFRAPVGGRVGVEDLTGDADFGVVDLAAAVAGLGHQAQGDHGQGQDHVEHRLVERGQRAVAPDLHIGEHAGDAEAEQRHQGPVAVGVDAGLGDIAVGGRIGQGPHGRGAGDVGGGAQDAADHEGGERGPLHHVVIERQTADEEEQGEHKSHGREVVQDDVDVRPRLRGGAVVVGDLELLVRDLPAHFADDDHVQQGEQRQAQDQVQEPFGRALELVLPPQHDPGGDAGNRQRAQRRPRPEGVRIRRHRRDGGSRGQGRHGAGAADFRGDAEDGQAAEHEKTQPLHHRVLGDHGGHEEPDREYQAHRREDTHKQMEMRPTGWDQMHLGPPPRSENGRASFVRG